jgi:alpha-tubulin suppressor-like RCC1 family protein
MLWFSPPVVKVNIVSFKNWHHFPFLTYLVFSMGLNCFGQCGFPLSPSPSSPDNLLPLQPLHTPSPVVKVCCGLDHTHFLTCEGLLYSCGWSDDGQTGTGCRGSVATPTRVAGDVMTERVRDVQCCADTSLAITGKAQFDRLETQRYDVMMT